MTAPGIHAALGDLVLVALGMTDSLSPMQHFTCAEAEAFAGVIRAAGKPELADQLLDAHRLGDDADGDSHSPIEYPTPAPLPFVIDERIVGVTTGVHPIDPAIADRPAREVYTTEGIVFEYLDENDHWVEFDRHPA